MSRVYLDVNYGEKVADRANVVMPPGISKTYRIYTKKFREIGPAVSEGLVITNPRISYIFEGNFPFMLY